jgi:hypothetical protein
MNQALSSLSSEKEKEMENLCKSFLRIVNKEQYAKLQCKLIKDKVKLLDLPLLDQNKYKQFKKIFKESSVDNYGIANMFWQLKNIFIEIYSHDKTDQDIINIIYYLTFFDEYYFKQYRKFLTRTEVKKDFELSISITELEFEIKGFIYRYKFLLKNEDDVMDLLNSV